MDKTLCRPGDLIFDLLHKSLYWDKLKQKFDSYNSRLINKLEYF